MKLTHRIALGAVGGALALTLAVGGVTAYAQETDSETVAPAAPETPALMTGAFGRMEHRGGFGGRGDGNQYLADALGITVEELQAARREAHAAMLEDAVAAGDITQEQADLMLARQAVAAYVDHEALEAETEGMTRAEAAAVRHAAFEAAVAEALAAGDITQAQADALLAAPVRGFSGSGGRAGRFGDRIHADNATGQ